MARYRGPRCKLCRRVGAKICSKSAGKCAFERRGTPPGYTPQRRRRKISDRGQQLLEKQKVRHTYGVLEKQFRRIYKEAQRRPGVTGENLLTMLELRLDNVVYRMGFAESRPQARQVVGHGHITVNGRKADIASMELRVGDRVGWTDRGRKTKFFELMKAWQGGQEVADWVAVDPAKLEGDVVALPTRDQIDQRFNESAIVEYYSR